MPLAVIAVVGPSGLVMLQEEFTLQLLPPVTIIQEEAGVRVPDIIKGHAGVLQILEELPPSRELQSFPPLAGDGLVQVRVCIPLLPQAVTLHPLHVLQPPSTGHATVLQG